MTISTKGRYAIIIMIDLSKLYKEDRFVSLNEIYERNVISYKIFRKDRYCTMYK